MGKKDLVKPFSWSLYSKKLIRKITNPHSYGFFTEKEAKERKMRLAVGSEGKIEDGNFISMYLLVDPDDGSIVDARYQLFGQSALIGAAEVACEIIVGKNYDQAKRVSADLIDNQAKDKSKQQAFPPETYPHLNLVISAIDEACNQCMDIPLPSSYVAPPVSEFFDENLSEDFPDGYPGWDELDYEEQVKIIEEVLDRDIRPYIALDGGGVSFVKLNLGREVIISYQGTCTSCMSAVGATLSYIQQTLKRKVHPEITVIPDM